MMTVRDWNAASASLADVVEAWFTDNCDEFPFPWIGRNCYGIMAKAALAVLHGMEDSQEYLREDGQLE